MKGKNQTTSIITIISILIAIFSITSCRNNFDFEEEYKKSNQELVFQSNFEQEFGKISPNQSWDFTETGATRATRASNINTTISAVDPLDSFDKINDLVSDSKSSWGNSKNRKKFVMTVPPNAFYIYPIELETDGTSMWSLYLQIGDPNTYEPIKIMQRYNYNNIYGFSSTGQIDAFSKNWKKTGIISGYYQYTKNKGLKIELPRSLEGESMYFYLELDKDSGVSGMYGKKGSRNSSLNDGIFTPVFSDISSYIPKGKEYLMVGCEDATTKNGQDFSDFVFLIVGDNKIPQKMEVTESTTHKRTIEYVSKRYMVEDLGSVESSDIDFNDIVFDIEKKTTNQYKVEMNNYGTITTTDIEGSEETTYTAKLWALGGTMNIEVYLTGTDGTNTLIFNKKNAGFRVATMYNTNWIKDNGDGKYDKSTPLKSISISDLASEYQWRPDDNNVMVKVYDKSSTTDSDFAEIDERTKVITFPAKGTVPYMIAVPTTQLWNWEQVSVFESTKLEGCYLNLKKQVENSSGN